MYEVFRCRKNTRLFNWRRIRIWPYVVPWHDRIYTNLHSTTGLNVIRTTALMAWETKSHGHRCSGIKSLCIRDLIIDLALDKPALSPGEIAVCHTDEKAYFVSESTVYRLLKQQDLITSPADILVQDSDNCPCYISGEFAAYLGNKGMTHARSRAYHPQTHDKMNAGSDR